MSAIRVRGSLVVERKSGRRGNFNVGELTTAIGIFDVKDTVIEQFEPGSYTGDFLIRWIAPDSFSWRGRVFVKVRAELEEVFIDDAQDAPAPASPPEPDPLDHDVPRELPAPPPRRTAKAGSEPAPRPSEDGVPTAGQPAPELPSDGATIDLFDAEVAAMVAQRHPVKLDPTVDRERFRAQRDALKASGYSFDAKAQTWMPPAA